LIRESTEKRLSGKIGERAKRREGRVLGRVGRDREPIDQLGGFVIDACGWEGRKEKKRGCERERWAGGNRQTKYGPAKSNVE